MEAWRACEILKNFLRDKIASIPHEWSCMLRRLMPNTILSSRYVGWYWNICFQISVYNQNVVRKIYLVFIGFTELIIIEKHINRSIFSNYTWNMHIYALWSILIKKRLIDMKRWHASLKILQILSKKFQVCSKSLSSHTAVSQNLFIFQTCSIKALISQAIH